MDVFWYFVKGEGILNVFGQNIWTLLPGAYPEIFRGGVRIFFSHTFSIFGRGPKNFLIQISISRGGPDPIGPPLATPMFITEFKINWKKIGFQNWKLLHLWCKNLYEYLNLVYQKYFRIFSRIFKISSLRNH